MPVIPESAAISTEATRLYVIGDIHGRLDLLERAIAAIGEDLARYGSDALTVTLGDYVDRGPASRGVIDRLAQSPFPTPYVALKGNHEGMLIDFLDDPELGTHWRMQGGEQTLQSYGVAVRPLMVGKNNAEAAARLRDALPESHFAFFDRLRTSLQHGRFFLCHAGVRPGVPLGEQSEHDLLWIRGEFLKSQADFGKMVVHGHTPVPKPEVLPNRINIDTGAFSSGRLTCIVLEHDGYRFLDL
ncbi:MAG TPA: metallophosphoesterase family protein [Pseudolabrys sp.]|nr:metallophosphoesterase family protein [Pseudolabrys sp.]